MSCEGSAVRESIWCLNSFGKLTQYLVKDVDMDYLLGQWYVVRYWVVGTRKQLIQMLKDVKCISPKSDLSSIERKYYITEKDYDQI